jgi:hypothetical protein
MNMEAIEFTTKIEDGTIKIPKKYLGNLPSEFRVIILISETEKPKSSRKKLTAFKVKTKGLHFDRNEANKR